MEYRIIAINNELNIVQFQHFCSNISEAKYMAYEWEDAYPHLTIKIEEMY